MVTQAIDYLRKQQRFSQLVGNEEQLPDIPDEAGIAETGGRISEEMLMAFETGRTGHILGHTDLPQGNGQKRDTRRIGTF